MGGALVLLAGTTACSKEKTCRCTVQGRALVRVIKIEHGACEDIHAYSFHNELDSLRIDSLLCTDHEFAIDSIFKN